MTVWPSGLRRWLKAPVRKGVGSNPTAVTYFRRAGFDIISCALRLRNQCLARRAAHLKANAKLSLLSKRICEVRNSCTTRLQSNVKVCAAFRFLKS